jgi:beta-glucanase (GH16 family)
MKTCHATNTAILRLLLLLVLVHTTSLQVTAQRYELVWSDEFDGDTLGPAWVAWNGTAYNNELQCYTPNAENLFLRDGHLHLRALRQTRQCGGRTTNFTSARISTDSTRMGWEYGRFEARIKMPATQGFWPAFWLMPTRNIGWPRGGEIDIMEFRSNLPNQTNGAIHFWREGCTGNPVQCRQYFDKTYPTPFDLSQDFHVYALDWSPGIMRWYLNDVLFWEIRGEAIRAEFDPFTGPFYIILNLAVGGDYLPNPDETTQFPQSLLVDYVRVYQDVNAKPTLEIEGPSSLNFPAGAPIPLQLHAADTDGSVETITLLLDEQELATLPGTTTAFEIPPLMEGCYTLRGKATDNNGATSPLTAPLAITVGHGCTEAPWNESSFRLPGLIPAWQYNRGGQHRAYFEHQANVNLGAADPDLPRRFEAVDLRRTSHPHAGISVFNKITDEWLAYDVDITTADPVFVELELTAEVTSSVDVYLNDVLLYSINRIRAEENWQTFRSDPLTLPVGPARLRVQTRTGNVELVSIQLKPANGTAIDIPGIELPAGIALGAPYPNPFNPITRVPVRNEIPEEVRLRVFDTAGRLIVTLHDGQLLPGEHDFDLDLTQQSSGLYMVVLEATGDRQVRPVTLLK